MAKDIKGSTRFPFVGLKRALKRAEAIFKAGKGGDVLVSDAFALWEYSSKSSGGFQTVASLKMYGLCTDEGTHDKRRLAFTEEGKRYFLDERPQERAKLLKEFAIKPHMLRMLWQKWGAEPPEDVIARSHLKVDVGLSEQSARSLLSIFKENIAFADLKGSAMMEPEMEDAGDDGKDDEPPPPPPNKDRHEPMEGERILADGLLSKTANFRIVVSGHVGVKEIENLIKKLELDKEILSDPDEPKGEPVPESQTKENGDG